MTWSKATNTYYIQYSTTFLCREEFKAVSKQVKKPTLKQKTRGRFFETQRVGPVVCPNKPKIPTQKTIPHLCTKPTQVYRKSILSASAVMTGQCGPPVVSLSSSLFLSLIVVVGMDSTILFASVAAAASYAFSRSRMKRPTRRWQSIRKKQRLRVRRSVESVRNEIGDVLFRRAYRMSYGSFHELHGLLQPSIVAMLIVGCREGSVFSGSLFLVHAGPLFACAQRYPLQGQKPESLGYLPSVIFGRVGFFTCLDTA